MSRPEADRRLRRSAAGIEQLEVRQLLTGDFESAVRFGGAGSDAGLSIATDTNGSVYTTGVFNGTVDFDPGAGVTNLISAGGFDIFVSKSDSAGNLVWARRLGGTGTDESHGVAVDGSGNVYSTGIFNGTADFDLGAGISNLTSVGSADIFVSKLDAAGNFVWAKRFGGVAFDRSNGVSLDGSGNVYTTGYFNGTADFDPGGGVTNLTSAGLEDIFVTKLDSAGTFVWAKQLGGTSGDQSNGIAVDGSGNVFTTGYFRGTADFDPSGGVTNLTSAGFEDIFVSKLDSAGNFVWARQLGGTSGEESKGVRSAPCALKCWKLLGL